MSQADLEIVRRMHDEMQGQNLAARVGDLAEMRATLERVYAPDVEGAWATLNPEARTFVGYDGLMDAFGEWISAFEEYYVDAVDFIAAGEYVVVPSRQRGKGRESGALVELDAVIVYKLVAGRITRHREFDTLDEALAAAEAGAV